MTTRRREPTPEELQLLAAYSDTELSRMIGAARDTIRRWRRDYGIPNPSKTKQQSAPPPQAPPGYAEPNQSVRQEGQHSTASNAFRYSPQGNPSYPGPFLALPRAREKESAVLVMSDIHYGKRTASYSTAIAQERLRRLIPKLERIGSILDSSYHIDELVVCILGDVNDGSEIFPTQAHYQEISDPLRQAWEFASFLAEWLRSVQRTFPSIRVEAVAGNHGRTGKRVHEAANWDLATYHFLRLHLEGSGIHVHYAGRDGEDPFLRFVSIRGHRFLLYHGHAIRMYQTIAWYGLTQRMLRWQTVFGPFAALLCGHFHTFGEMDINGTRILLTGTLVTDDQWTVQTLGLAAANRWHLFGVGDRRPITWRFDLELVESKGAPP